MGSNGTQILPTDFDSKSFLQSITDLKKTLEPATSCEGHLPIEQLAQVVQAGNATIASFKLFSVYSQVQLEELRVDLEAIARCIEKEMTQITVPRSGNVKFSEGGSYGKYLC